MEDYTDSYRTSRFMQLSITSATRLRACAILVPSDSQTTYRSGRYSVSGCDFGMPLSLLTPAPYRVEWTFFAISATSLARSVASHSSSDVLLSLGLGPSGAYTPPWLFIVAEIAVMFPRAVRGHRWYQDKFGDDYPPERRAVIPFIV